MSYIFPMGLPAKMIPEGKEKVKNNKSKHPSNFDSIRDGIITKRSFYGGLLNKWKERPEYEEMLEYTKSFGELSLIERAFFHPDFRDFALNSKENRSKEPTVDILVGYSSMHMLRDFIGKDECRSAGIKFMIEKQWPFGVMIRAIMIRNEEIEHVMQALTDFFGVISYIPKLREHHVEQAANAVFCISNLYDSHEMLYYCVQEFPQLRPYYKYIDMDFDQKPDTRFFDLSGKYSALNYDMYATIICAHGDLLESFSSCFIVGSVFNLSSSLSSCKENIMPLFEPEFSSSLLKNSRDFTRDMCDLLQERLFEFEGLLEENQLIGVVVDKVTFKRFKEKTVKQINEMRGKAMNILTTATFAVLIEGFDRYTNLITQRFNRINRIVQDNVVLATKGLAGMEQIQKNNEYIQELSTGIKGELKTIDAHLSIIEKTEKGIESSQDIIDEMSTTGETSDLAPANGSVKALVEELALSQKKEAEMRDQTNTLMATIDAKETEITDLKARVFELEQRPEIVSNAQIRISMSEYKDAFNSALSGKETAEDVLKILSATCNDLIVLESAIESARANKGFKGTRRLFETVNLLHDEYMPAILSGKPDSIAKEYLGNAYRANESDTVMKYEPMRKQREFVYKGKPQLFTKHLALGSTQGNCARVYFDIDQKDKRLVVAYCGDHLDTHRTS